MIQTFKISTGMGKTHDDLPFLTEDQYNEFNVIGYTGKRSNKKPCGRQEYLNSLNIGEFKVNQTKYDDGNFIEQFTITLVTEDSKEMSELPEWLQELWKLDPSIARKAEKEISNLTKIKDEVIKVWDEDGLGGEIQMKTPIAWQRVIRLCR